MVSDLKRLSLCVLVFLSSCRVPTDYSKAEDLSGSISTVYEVQEDYFIVFGKELTTMLFQSNKKRKRRLGKYTPITRSQILDVYPRLSELVSTELAVKDTSIKTKVLIWQLFPYENIKEDQIVHATCSVVLEEEQKAFLDTYSRVYRSVFDGEGHYFSFYYNQSEGTFY